MRRKGTDLNLLLRRVSRRTSNVRLCLLACAVCLIALAVLMPWMESTRVGATEDDGDVVHVFTAAEPEDEDFDDAEEHTTGRNGGASLDDDDDDEEWDGQDTVTAWKNAPSDEKQQQPAPKPKKDSGAAQPKQTNKAETGRKKPSASADRPRTRKSTPRKSGSDSDGSFFAITSVRDRTASRRSKWGSLGAGPQQLALTTRVSDLKAAAALLVEKMVNAADALQNRQDQRTYQRVAMTAFSHAVIAVPRAVLLTGTDRREKLLQTPPHKLVSIFPTLLPYPIIFDDTILIGAQRELEDLRTDAQTVAKALEIEKAEALQSRFDTGVVGLLDEINTILAFHSHAHRTVMNAAYPLLTSAASKARTEVARYTAAVNSNDEATTEKREHLKLLHKKRRAMTVSQRSLENAERRFRGCIERGKPTDVESLLTGLAVISHGRNNRATDVTELDALRDFIDVDPIATTTGILPSEMFMFGAHLVGSLVVVAICTIVSLRIQYHLTSYVHRSHSSWSSLAQAMVTFLLVLDQIIAPFAVLLVFAASEWFTSARNSTSVSRTLSTSEAFTVGGNKQRCCVALVVVSIGYIGVKIANGIEDAWMKQPKVAALSSPQHHHSTARQAFLNAKQEMKRKQRNSA